MLQFICNFFLSGLEIVKYYKDRIHNYYFLSLLFLENLLKVCIKCNNYSNIYLNVCTNNIVINLKIRSNYTCGKRLQHSNTEI